MGADGQLGQCLRKVYGSYTSLEFDFRNKKQLDITDPEAVIAAFETGRYEYCINAAAFTDVENAERNPKDAFEVNAKGAENLAMACKEFDVCLLHISTDYVFDGENEKGYTAEDIPNPINEYGKSKLAGEKKIQSILDRYFIIRTSWLYSEYGDNFYNNILKRARKGGVLQVTDAQKGCPTNANNLVKYLLGLLIEGKSDYGIHHFTDGQAMTWYEFAFKIIKEAGLQDSVKLEKATIYRTFAPRPKNSVLV